MTTTEIQLGNFGNHDDEPFDQAAAYAEPKNPWIHPSQRKKSRAPRLQTNWSAGVTGARKPWHALLESTVIENEWAKVEAALATAETASDSYFALQSDEAAEGHDISVQIRDAVRKDERPDFVRTDWAVETIAREVRWDDAHAAALNAGRNYTAVVSQVAREGIPALVERAEKARSKAKAVQIKAQAAVGEYLTVLQAIRSADADLKISGHGWHRTTEAEAAIPGKALAGLGDVARLLASTNPMVDGTYITDTSEALPLHTRQALNAEGGESGFYILLQVEALEGWQGISRFTSDHRGHYRRDLEFEKALKAKSFAQG